MAGESKEGGGGAIPYSGIAGALLLAVAVVVQQTRLDSARPIPGEASQLLSRSLHQDVEAHLWQDPLQAVAEFRDRKRKEAIQESQLRRLKGEWPAPKPAPPDDAHHIEVDLKGWLRSMMCAPSERDRHSVRLLMPMLMGERAEESAEMRRRTRYAVVAGLVNAGYSPDDASAIGYTYVPDEVRKRVLLPETIPFEWFVRTLGSGGRKEWILVLWLDATVFQEENPLAQFRALIDLLTPSCLPHKPIDKGGWDATVLGPIESTMLLRIRDAIEKEVKLTMVKAAGTQPGAALPAALRFVSASATGTLPGAGQFHVGSPHTTLTRLIGTDEALIAVLLDELSLRMKRIDVIDDKKPAALVISEHDTEYGRAFLRILRTKSDILQGEAARLEQKAKELAGYGLDVAPLQVKIEEAKRRERALSDLEVEPFSYLRQIDGGKGSARQKPKRGDKEGEKSDAQPPAQGIRAHGPSQIDYLDRLVHDIERYSEEQKRDIVAIGIFGNDVYDKLLILRALRPAFPKAQFVTTDMDARLLDTEEAAWTRNVVVATNFGLSLGRQVQRGTAPFRDGYQAASYLAAWLFGGRCVSSLMDDYGTLKAGPPWLRQPLLFEIGRHKLVPLGQLEDGKGGADLTKCRFGEAQLVAPASVRFQPLHKQPEIAPLHQALLMLLAVGVISLLCVWALRNPVAQEQGQRTSRARRTYLYAGIPSAALGCALGAGFMGWLAARYVQVPIFFMLYGVATAVLLCVGLWQINEGLSRGGTFQLAAGAALLGPILFLVIWAGYPALTANTEPFAWAEGVSVWPTQILRFLAVLVAAFSIWYIGASSVRGMRELSERYRLRHADGAGIESSKSMAVHWIAYSRNRTQRAGWTILAAIVYLAACVLFIIMPLDARPGIPVRGEFVPQVAALLSCGVYLGIVLLAGMMFSSGAFIVSILWKAQETVPWFPKAAIADFRAEHNIAHRGGRCRRLIDCCLSVQLVAQRTEWLIRLIYLPFAVFALNLIARSQLFDNWDTPTGLLIVLLIPFTIVIVCILWLRYATLRFHQKAIRKAERELVRLRGDGEVDEATRAQLERLCEKMRDEKRGAFQSILLQPLVRATLLPLGGFSFIEVMEQMVLTR